MLFGRPADRLPGHVPDRLESALQKSGGVHAPNNGYEDEDEESASLGNLVPVSGPFHSSP